MTDSIAQYRIGAKLGTIAAYAWSTDGMRLAVARGASTHDIVLLRGFKRAIAQLRGGEAAR